MKASVLIMTLLLGLTTQIVEGTPNAQAAVVADQHSANAFGSIPSSYFTQIRSAFHIYYGHTSHGSQVITGLSMLENQNGTRYALPPIHDDYGTDLGNPAWVNDTRNYLNGHPGTNLVMWSWCGQLSGYAPTQINAYLNHMRTLEAEYPSVVFVYMTGHLDGTGPSGTLYTNNNTIRHFCDVNNKVLFDFADIESYDPAGAYYPDGSDWCEWCTAWCQTHSCPDYGCTNCAHSQCFNCYRKGKAFWWLLARLAGWMPSGAIRYVDPNGVCNGNTPCHKTIQVAISAANDADQIRIVQGNYEESLQLDADKSVILQGSWDSSFIAQSGNTILTRAPWVTAGSLTLQELHIRPE